jgi:hypothetical protein
MNWRTRPWPVLLDRQVRRDRPSRRHSVSPAVVLHAHDDLLRRDSPGRVGPQRRPTVSDARFGKKRANCRRFAVRGAITARGRSRWRQVRSDIAVAGRISSGCSTRARESLLWPGRLGREAVAYRYRRRGPQRCRSLPGSRGPRLISRRQRKPRSRRQTLGPRPRPYPGRPPRPVDGPRQRTPGLERQVPRSARAVVPGVAVVRGAHGRDFGSMTIEHVPPCCCSSRQAGCLLQRPARANAATSRRHPVSGGADADLLADAIDCVVVSA